MATTIEGIGAPLTAQDLDKAESMLGHPLPEPYRDFLLSYNGGRTEPSDFESIWSGGPHDGLVVAGLHYLLTLNEVLSDTDRLSERIPEDTIIIGQDPGGNRLLMSLAGDDIGQVYYWMFSYDAYGEGDNEGVGHVAESFDGFLGELFDESDY